VWVIAKKAVSDVGASLLHYHFPKDYKCRKHSFAPVAKNGKVKVIDHMGLCLVIR